MLNYKTVNGYQIPDLKIPDGSVFRQQLPPDLQELEHNSRYIRYIRTKTTRINADTDRISRQLRETRACAYSR